MDKRAFFDLCRRGVMGPTLDQNEVSGSEAILSAMDGAPISHCAYALATAWHETAHTMQPIAEFGGDRYFTRLYDIKGDRPEMARLYGNITPGDGVRYRGRGYVQLTWKANYAKAEKETGHPLISKPDLAMRPDIAALVMRKGMDEGWFTGKAFKHYLPEHGLATREQFIGARRIINGTDKAGLIADYAIAFQGALRGADW